MCKEGNVCVLSVGRKTWLETLNSLVWYQKADTILHSQKANEKKKKQTQTKKGVGKGINHT